MPGLAAWAGGYVVCFAHDAIALQLVMTKTRPSICVSLIAVMLSIVAENNPASAQVNNYYAGTASNGQPVNLDLGSIRQVSAYSLDFTYYLGARVCTPKQTVREAFGRASQRGRLTDRNQVPPSACYQRFALILAVSRHQPVHQQVQRLFSIPPATLDLHLMEQFSALLDPLSTLMFMGDRASGTRLTSADRQVIFIKAS